MTWVKKEEHNKTYYLLPCIMSIVVKFNAHDVVARRCKKNPHKSII